MRRSDFVDMKVQLTTGGRTEVVNMYLMYRDLLIESLEFLSKFCILYIYSHGIKSYIMDILKIIDPEEKFF